MMASVAKHQHEQQMTATKKKSQWDHPAMNPKSKGFIEAYEQSLMKKPKEDLAAILKQEEELWNS
jgi:DNA-directed RNA polymerase alpha subunit